jgi:hypothetical protein
MDRNILNLQNRSGWGLWEAVLGLVVVLMIVSVTVGCMKGIQKSVMVRRTFEDMSGILTASLQYRHRKGHWPGSLADIAEGFRTAPACNIWGHSFILGSDTGRVWVETDIPVDIPGYSPVPGLVVSENSGGLNRVRVSSGVVYGKAARLVYEKKNRSNK